MEYAVLITFACIVGMLLPIQAAANAGVSRYFGDFAYAVLISFVIGIILVSCYILITKPVLNSNLSSLRIPNYILLGGLISVTYTAAITFLSPRLGVGNTLFVIIVGQIVAALIVDHFGVMGAVTQEVSLKRIIGVSLIIIGVFLARKEI